jgi:hypothetical protein
MPQLAPAWLVTLRQFGMSLAIDGSGIVHICHRCAVLWLAARIDEAAIGTRREQIVPPLKLPPSKPTAQFDLASEFDHPVRPNAEEFRCRQRVRMHGLGRPAGQSQPSVMREPLR